MTAVSAGSPRKCEFSILPATEADLDAIMKIEEACFNEPWQRDAMRDEITGSAWSTVVKVEVEGELAGFAVYWTVADERHLQNVATAPAYRRRGVGDALVRHVVDHAYRTGAAIVLLEVRVSNEPAKRLYAAHGFRAIGVRRGYYQDNGEDAIVMGLPVADGVL
jgi:[ribosomal protein S18]-alanine N-acetyltransferase